MSRVRWSEVSRCSNSRCSVVSAVQNALHRIKRTFCQPRTLLHKPAHNIAELIHRTRPPLPPSLERLLYLPFKVTVLLFLRFLSGGYTFQCSLSESVKSVLLNAYHYNCNMVYRARIFT